MLTPSELESLLGQPESVSGAATHSTRKASRSVGRPISPQLPTGLDREQHFALEAMHRQLAHELSGHLSRLLNHTVAVELNQIDHTSGGVPLDDQYSPACFVALQFEQFSKLVWLGIDAHLLWPLLDRLLGGTGDMSHADHDRPPTEIELRLVAHAAEAFVTAIQSTWQAVLPLRGHVAQVETNALKLEGWCLERPAVRTVFVLEPEGQRCVACLRIDLADVIVLLDRLAESGRTSPGKLHATGGRDELESAGLLSGDTVECVLLLAETRMGAEEVQNLSVGDVILTDKPSADGMTLQCGDGTCRKATLGQTHGRKAARVVAGVAADNSDDTTERPAGS